MGYDSDMRKTALALFTAAVVFAGAGYVAAQQKQAAKPSAANTVIVYKSPT